MAFYCAKKYLVTGNFRNCLHRLVSPQHLWSLVICQTLQGHGHFTISLKYVNYKACAKTYSIKLDIRYDHYCHLYKTEGERK